MFSKKLERLKRPPTKLDHEDYQQSLLAQFQLFQIHGCQHGSILKSLAEIEKVKTARMDFKELNKYEDDSLVHYKYETALEALQRNEMKVQQKMPSDLKRKLENFIPVVWKQLYPQEYGTLQNDVREHFQQTMLSPCRLKKFVFKFAGHAKNYEKFLEVKQKMSKKLLLTKKPVQLVLDYAVRELPQEIFNLKNAPRNCRTAMCAEGLGGRKAMPYTWLLRFLEKNIEEMNYHILWVWYPRLIELLKIKMRSIKHVESRLLMCMEGLIRREIRRIKMFWLANFLKEISHIQTTPLLEFQLEIEAYEIQLNPSMSTIMEMYASIARKIANIGVQKLSPLKLEINMTTDICTERFINLEMDEIYLSEYIADLKEAVKQSYEPVDTFFQNFKTTYNCIIQSADFDHYDFMAASHPFLHYVVKMMNYSSQKNALLLLPQSEHFIMATVLTTPAVSQLVLAAKNFMKLVSDEMTAQHIDYLKTICNDYDQIKSTISKEPESTEELIEIKNYMNMVKTEHLGQLDERVQWARHIGSQLQTLTEFSQYHWNLYIITLNWVHDMSLVFEESAAQLVHFSELFKQYLEVRIFKFNDAIENFCTKIDLLNNVTDLSELKSGGEYANFYRNIIARLQELDDCMKWINKEEHLLNLSVTSYPKLVEAKVFVSKFYSKES